MSTMSSTTTKPKERKRKREVSRNVTYTPQRQSTRQAALNNSDSKKLAEDDSSASETRQKKQSKSEPWEGLFAILGEDHSDWKTMFTKLLKYREENDNVSPSLNEENDELARWACQQRVAYNARMLDETRRKCLEQINFIFQSTSNGTISKKVESDETKWEAKLQKLMAYKKEHGDFLVPVRLPELGSWVLNQRSEYNNFTAKKKSKITQERVDKLNAIGFCWKPPRGRAAAKPYQFNLGAMTNTLAKTRSDM